MIKRFLTYLGFFEEPLPCEKKIKKPGRNAYIQFLQAYRDQVGGCKTNREIVREAAVVWRKMTPLEKLPYKKAARDAPFVFTTRNRRTNKMLNHLRRSILTEDQVDLYYLREAMKDLQKWKMATEKKLAKC